MHVRVWGEQGPPLVLLHMGPLSGRMFDQIAPLLAVEHRVIVPDRIGFGGSDHPVAPIGIPGYALATLDALDALAVSEFDVLGVHTGSCEAIELATSHRNRVRRVALMSILAFTEKEANDFNERFTPQPPPTFDGSHLLRQWNRWMNWRPSGWDLELAQQCVIDVLCAGPESRWGLQAVLDYPTASRVKQVKQPLLVLAPNDYVSDQTKRGLAVLSADVEVVEVALDPPGSTPVALFSLARREIVEHVSAFLA